MDGIKNPIFKECRIQELFRPGVSVDPESKQGNPQYRIRNPKNSWISLHGSNIQRLANRDSEPGRALDQLITMLMKTGLSNVLLPTLFNFVNNIVQRCYT